MTQKSKYLLTRWIIFSVVFALLPFLFKILSEISRGHEISLEMLFGRGELLLVSVTLCAVAVGELFEITPIQSIATLIAGGSAIIIIAITSFYYANISVGGEDLKIDMVIWMSISLFLCSVVVSSACIIIASTREIKK
ncbi:MAG: hypothetical protein ABFS56_26450 [Pseudomonadota bacterium]